MVKIGVTIARKSQYITEKVKSSLSLHGISYEIVKGAGRRVQELDFLMIVGTDRDFLEALQGIKSPPIIVAVSPPGYYGFLCSIPWEKLEEVLEKISSGSFDSQKLMRLKGIVDGKKNIYGINDVAIFPSRSATTMEYTLAIDSEVIWRDLADGLIFSTPIGSTAYALSAGGSVILPNAEVFQIVPVNSTNPARRSLIVSKDSKAEVKDFSSKCSIEAIADGVRRIKVEEEVEIFVDPEPLEVVKIGRGVGEFAKRKLSSPEELTDLPPSAKFVYKMLEMEGPMTLKEIVERTSLPERTVRYILPELMKKGLVERFSDLRDPRRYIYRIKRGKVEPSS